MITIARPTWRWDPLRELDRMQREVSGIFSLPRPRRMAAFPPLNIHSGDEDVIITSEIPGVDPADVDLTVTGDTLTIKGTRKPHESRARPGIAGSGDRRLLPNRAAPYNVDAGKVQAECGRRTQDRAPPGRG